MVFTKNTLVFLNTTENFNNTSKDSCQEMSRNKFSPKPKTRYCIHFY